MPLPALFAGASEQARLRFIGLEAWPSYRQA